MLFVNGFLLPAIATNSRVRFSLTSGYTATLCHIYRFYIRYIVFNWVLTTIIPLESPEPHPQILVSSQWPKRFFCHHTRFHCSVAGGWMLLTRKKTCGTCGMDRLSGYLVTRLAMCSHPIWWSPNALTHWPRTISGMSSWLNHQAPNALGLGSASNSQLDLSYIYMENPWSMVVVMSLLYLILELLSSEPMIWKIKISFFGLPSSATTPRASLNYQ